jgi:hypothetical protein
MSSPWRSDLPAKRIREALAEIKNVARKDKRVATVAAYVGGEHGDVSSVIKNVSDDMVEAFVKCGPVDEVLEKIEPFWDVVDSLCPMIPYRDLTMEQLTMYNGGLYAMVAEAKRRQAGG